MFPGEFLIMLGIAVLAVALLVGVLGWRRVENGPLWDSAIFVFLVLYPALWVARLWVRPAGPTVLGVYWVPPLVVGLIVAFIIGAALPRRRRRTEIVIGPGDPAWRVPRMPFGLFFWLLMLLYLGALVAGYSSGGGSVTVGG
jgi:hypothetical protein